MGTHFVYRVFDAGDGRLLYVGLSKNPSTRWKQHCLQRPGFKLINTRFRVQGPYTKAVAAAMERVALQSEAPLLGQAKRTASQRVEHQSAEHQFTSLPHLAVPVMQWHRFEARPLDGFAGYWRVFSDGQPTSVVAESEMGDWKLRGAVA